MHTLPILTPILLVLASTNEKIHLQSHRASVHAQDGLLNFTRSAAMSSSKQPFRAPSTSLSDNLEVFAQIFEFAPDAKLLVGADGRILKVNLHAEEMFGYAREELLGQL